MQTSSSDVEQKKPIKSDMTFLVFLYSGGFSALQTSEQLKHGELYALSRCNKEVRNIALYVLLRRGLYQQVFFKRCSPVFKPRFFSCKQEVVVSKSSQQLAPVID